MFPGFRTQHCNDVTLLAGVDGHDYGEDPSHSNYLGTLGMQRALPKVDHQNPHIVTVAH